MGMRMKIKHVTSYHYEEPVSYALQQLRLTPKTRPGQKVISWTTKASDFLPETYPAALK